jgi:hypothetical protein
MVYQNTFNQNKRENGYCDFQKLIFQANLHFNTFNIYSYEQFVLLFVTYEFYADFNYVKIMGKKYPKKTFI